MRRVAIAALVVLAALPAVAAGTQVNAAVDNVTVTPTSPAPGEPVKFEATIRNPGSNGDPLVIEEVELRDGGNSGLPVYERVENVGTLSPGAKITVPLTHTFEEAGARDLRVRVEGTNADTGESVELRYPVAVSIQERHPQIEVETDDSVTDVASNGTVTIANGLDTDIQNVEVTVSGDGVTMLDGRSVFASVATGETATGDFRFRPERADTRELRATVTYTLPSGTERTVTQNRTIETEATRGGIVLEASPSGSGMEQTVAVDIINQGNTRAEDIVVTGVGENVTVSQTVVDSVPARSTERVRLNATLSEPTAEVLLTADYERGSSRQTATATRTLRATPATIELTGLDVTRGGGLLQITGTTSNVGTTAAQSVIVRVRPGENVEPAPPSRDFFVGEVPGSDFSSFDLTARATGNVSAIPLEVSYISDGTRTTQQFTVPVDSRTGEPEQESSGGGPGAGLFAVLGLAVVAILVVAGIIVRRYRRGDDDEIDV